MFTLKFSIQLKELRSVAKNDVIEPTHFIAVLRDLENSMELSVSCTNHLCNVVVHETSSLSLSLSLSLSHS